MERKSSSCWQIRYEVAALACFGFFNVYAMRVNLSVAVLQMKPQFGWSSLQQGIILSSFFIGYICTQVAGGWLGTRFGGKWVFGFGVLCTAVLTIATPWVASNYPLFIAVRILEGVGEGVTFPAMHAIWARWAPPLERSKLSTYSYSGAAMGTIISMPLSGWLCKVYGWPSVFYICGALGVLWFALWICLIQSDPRNHSRISESELRYIVESISTERAGEDATTHGSLNAPLVRDSHAAVAAATRSKAPPEQQTPWREIFSSCPVWAIIIGHTDNNWGFYNLLTCMPDYLKNVLQLDLKNAAFMSCLPYICLFVVSNLWSPIVDRLRRSGYGSTGFWRKFSQGFGHLVAAAALIACGYPPSSGREGHSGSGLDIESAITDSSDSGSILHMDSRDYYVVILLCIAVGASGFPMAGFNVNHLDIAPQYAGVLMGITNTAATIPGFVAPALTGAIASADVSSTHSPCHDDDQAPACLLLRHELSQQWRTVFFIAAGIYVFGVIFYTIFASGVKQPWATGRNFVDKI